MYAYFSDIGCDPLAEGIVTNGNQVTVSKQLLSAAQCKALVKATVTLSRL